MLSRPSLASRSGARRRPAGALFQLPRTAGPANAVLTSALVLAGLLWAGLAAARINTGSFEGGFGAASDSVSKTRRPSSSGTARARRSRPGLPYFSVTVVPVIMAAPWAITSSGLKVFRQVEEMTMPHRPISAREHHQFGVIAGL